MFPVSAAMHRAVRSSNRVTVRAAAYRAGAVISNNLPVENGQWTIDRTRDTRRTCSLTLSREVGLWAALAEPGTEVRPYRGVRYVDGTVEWVPGGVFRVTEQSMRFAPGGVIELSSMPDRWSLVQRAEFLTPQSVSSPRATVRSEIVRLVREAVPEAGSVIDTATSGQRVGPLVWERDRAGAVTDMATSIGAEVFFDADGALVLRDVSSAGYGPSWDIDGQVLIDAERTRSSSRTYNAVVVTAEAVDGAVPFAPVVVTDDDPASPTYFLGPFGQAPYHYSSPSIKTKKDAKRAANALLGRLVPLAEQIDLTSVCHPARDAGDRVNVTLPAEAPGGGMTTVAQSIDSVTVPLGPEGTQQVRCRSTRPDVDPELDL